MKLRYYLKNGKKTYTLKETINEEPTKPAHYKFVKISPNVQKKKFQCSRFHKNLVAPTSNQKSTKKLIKSSLKKSNK